MKEMREFHEELTTDDDHIRPVSLVIEIGGPDATAAELRLLVSRPQRTGKIRNRLATCWSRFHVPHLHGRGHSGIRSP